MLDTFYIKNNTIFTHDEILTKVYTVIQSTTQKTEKIKVSSIVRSYIVNISYKITSPSSIEIK